MINSGSYNNEQSSMMFPDMTALLDVIFILLVFLLLTVNVAPRALQINLPESGSASPLDVQDNQTITITLFTEYHRWALDDSEFDHWNDFENAFIARLTSLKSLQADKPDIILAADKNVSVKQLLKVLVFLQQHDLQAANILMKHPNEDTQSNGDD